MVFNLRKRMATANIGDTDTIISPNDTTVAQGLQRPLGKKSFKIVVGTKETDSKRKKEGVASPVPSISCPDWVTTFTYLGYALELCLIKLDSARDRKRRERAEEDTLGS